MRASLLIAALCVILCGSVVSAQSTASGTWGIFADNACSISLFSSNFINGTCGSQSSGSSTIYYITTCSPDGTKWVEVEYSDVTCKTVMPNTTNSNESGACFVSGQYWGQVICPTPGPGAAPSDDEPEIDTPVVIDQSAPIIDTDAVIEEANILFDPVSAASFMAAPSMIFVTLAAIVALIMA